MERSQQAPEADGSDLCEIVDSIDIGTSGFAGSLLRIYLHLLAACGCLSDRAP